MHAFGADQAAAYLRADHHQTGTGTRRGEHRHRQRQGGDPRRTAAQHLRPGQLRDLLRRRQRRPRFHGLCGHRSAKQHHSGTNGPHVRTSRPAAMPRPHLHQHRGVRILVRGGSRQDPRSGRLHDGPRESDHGPQLQIFHFERGVDARNHRRAGRYPHPLRERHPRTLLCGVQLRQGEGRERLALPASGPRYRHRHRHGGQTLLRQERLRGRIRPHPLLRQREDLRLRQERLPGNRGVGYRHRGENLLAHREGRQHHPQRRTTTTSRSS